MMNKRGISPVLASVFLISLAVALGIGIMTFGRAQVEQEAQCAIDVNLKMSTIDPSAQFCYDPANKLIHLTIENGVNIKVEGLIVNVIGTEQAETFELNDAVIEKAGSYVSVIPYDSSAAGEIRQIKITPAVILFDEAVICIEKSLTIETIELC